MQSKTTFQNGFSTYKYIINISESISPPAAVRAIMTRKRAHSLDSGSKSYLDLTLLKERIDWMEHEERRRHETCMQSLAALKCFIDNAGAQQPPPTKRPKHNEEEKGDSSQSLHSLTELSLSSELQQPRYEAFPLRTLAKGLAGNLLRALLREVSSKYDPLRSRIPRQLILSGCKEIAATIASTRS